ncbi:DUF1837 domain-containing protein [Persicimonas caeni]|uniref:DUF1837 domain-containing protein n=1 Tax=Persicimonas caeni TaxID=2292766 RepID=A0A4Y6PVH9_PERCE|nr:DUF1837 domain-containing protein [Persicimonas caeni]QDG52129.1 DUF1837 domain-containing protein [Persicimonas caeni]QED33351.1 DUF1837 domain-containing protein [Persicimonas caeni]
MSLSEQIDVDFEQLRVQFDAFMDTLYVVRDHFNIPPEKDHVATCISYADLQEMREEFVVELVNCIEDFVYSKAKQTEMLALFEKKRSERAASRHLFRHCVKKFRVSSVKGQFSELLLSNLIQYFFKAVPLLRKMKITTNPELERNGADAIHIGRRGDKFILYIGEAKTYDRKSGGLRDALTDAVGDLIQHHYKNHRRELDLYVYDEFLPPELEAVAQGYQSGEATNIEVHLVCIVTYDEKNSWNGATRQEILDSVIDSIWSQTQRAKSWKVFESIPTNLIPRINYILFPVQEMDDLLNMFKQELGV